MIAARQKLRDLILYTSPQVITICCPLQCYDWAGEELVLGAACKNGLSQLFANCNKGFYERQKVMEKNGAYLSSANSKDFSLM